MLESHHAARGKSTPDRRRQWAVAGIAASGLIAGSVAWGISVLDSNTDQSLASRTTSESTRMDEEGEGAAEAVSAGNIGASTVAIGPASEPAPEDRVDQLSFVVAVDELDDEAVDALADRLRDAQASESELYEAEREMASAISTFESERVALEETLQGLDEPEEEVLEEDVVRELNDDASASQEELSALLERLLEEFQP